VWLTHHHLPPQARHEFNLPVSFEPPAGSTPDTLRRALESIVRRHESLRTTFHVDGTNGPVQQVESARAVELTCHQVDGPAPVSMADAVRTLVTAEFRLDQEWPVRAGVFCRDTTPILMVVVQHHTSADDWSTEILRREFAEVHTAILADRPIVFRPVRDQPVDLARREATPEYAAVNRRALNYWDRELSRIPADLFVYRRRPAPEGTRAVSVSLSSPEMLTAARTLATRYRVWPSVIYQAAFTGLLAAYATNPLVAYLVYTGNRRSDLHAQMLSCLFQPVLVSVDCSGDPSFAELVRRTAERAEESSENSYCAYDEAMEATARRGFERGLGLRLGIVFNYLRYPYMTRGGRRTILTRNQLSESWSHLPEDTYLRVSEWKDCVVATLNARPEVLAAKDVERFLLGLEALIVAQASVDRPIPLSEFATMCGFQNPPVPTGETVVVGGSPIDLQRTAACLETHAAIDVAKVFAETSENGSRLIGYVTATGVPPSPRQLRAHLLTAAHQDSLVGCPSSIMFCTAAPEDRDSAAAWSTQPQAHLSAEADAIEGRSPAETDLVAAVCEANRLEHVRPSDSYVMAGGRLLNIPRLQRRLREWGWEVPPLYDIASVLPLSAIANRMAAARVAASQTEVPQ
jgi:hypothetical protein